MLNYDDEIEGIGSSAPIQGAPDLSYESFVSFLKNWKPSNNKPVPKKDVGFISGNLQKAAGSFGQMAGGALGMLGDLAGSESIKNYGLGAAEGATMFNRDVNERMMTPESDLIDTYKKEGLWEAVKETPKFVAEQAIQNAPLMAITGGITGVAARKGAQALLMKEISKRVAAGEITAEAAAKLTAQEVAGLVGKDVLAKASTRGAIEGGLATTGQWGSLEAGSIYAEQEEKDPLKALLYGTAAGALEFLPEFALARRSGIANKLMGTTAKSADDAAKAPVKGFGQFAGRVGLEMAKQAASEGAQEYSQTILEQLGKSQDPTTRKAIEEQIVSAIAGAGIGGGMGGTVSAFTTKFVPKVNSTTTATDLTGNAPTLDELANGAVAPPPSATAPNTASTTALDALQNVASTITASPVVPAQPQAAPQVAPATATAPPVAVAPATAPAAPASGPSPQVLASSMARANATVMAKDPRLPVNAQVWIATLEAGKLATPGFASAYQKAIDKINSALEIQASSAIPAVAQAVDAAPVPQAEAVVAPQEAVAPAMAEAQGIEASIAAAAQETAQLQQQGIPPESIDRYKRAAKSIEKVPYGGSIVPHLQRSMRLGYNSAMHIAQLMEQQGLATVNDSGEYVRAKQESATPVSFGSDSAAVDDDITPFDLKAAETQAESIAASSAKQTEIDEMLRSLDDSSLDDDVTDESLAMARQKLQGAGSIDTELGLAPYAAEVTPIETSKLVGDDSINTAANLYRQLIYKEMDIRSYKDFKRVLFESNMKFKEYAGYMWKQIGKRVMRDLRAKNPEFFEANKEALYDRFFGAVKQGQQSRYDMNTDVTADEVDELTADEIFMDTPDESYDEVSLGSTPEDDLTYEAMQDKEVDFGRDNIDVDMVPVDEQQQNKYYEDATKAIDEENKRDDRSIKLDEAFEADRELDNVFNFAAPVLAVDTVFSDADVVAAARIRDSGSYITGDFAYAIYTGKLADEAPVLRKRISDDIAFSEKEDAEQEQREARSGSVRLATLVDSAGNRIQLPIAGLNELIVDYTYPQDKAEPDAEDIRKAQNLINERAFKVYNEINKVIRSAFNRKKLDNIYTANEYHNEVQAFITANTKDGVVNKDALKKFLESYVTKEQQKDLAAAIKNGELVKYAHKLAKERRERISEGMKSAARTLFSPYSAQTINDRNDVYVVSDKSVFSGKNRKDLVRIMEQFIDNSGVFTGDQKVPLRKELREAADKALDAKATKEEKDNLNRVVVRIMIKSVSDAIEQFKMNAHRMEYGKPTSKEVINKKLEYSRRKESYYPSYISMHGLISDAINNLKAYENVFMSFELPANSTKEQTAAAKEKWTTLIEKIEGGMPSNRKVQHIGFVVNGLFQEGRKPNGVYYTNINAVNAYIFNVYDYIHTKYNNKAYDWTYFLRPENEKTDGEGFLGYDEVDPQGFSAIKEFVGKLPKGTKLTRADQVFLSKISENKAGSLLNEIHLNVSRLLNYRYNKLSSEKLFDDINNEWDEITKDFKISKALRDFVSTKSGLAALEKLSAYMPQPNSAANDKESFNLRVAQQETRTDEYSGEKVTPRRSGALKGIQNISELEIDLKESGLIPPEMQLAAQRLIPREDVQTRYENWKKSFKPVAQEDMSTILKLVKLVFHRGDVVELRGSKERWKPIWGIQPYEGTRISGNWKRLATYDDILIGDKVPIGYSETMRYIGETNNPYDKEYFVDPTAQYSVQSDDKGMMRIIDIIEESVQDEETGEWRKVPRELSLYKLLKLAMHNGAVAEIDTSVSLDDFVREKVKESREAELSGETAYVSYGLFSRKNNKFQKANWEYFKAYIESLNGATYTYVESERTETKKGYDGEKYSYKVPVYIFKKNGTETLTEEEMSKEVRVAEQALIRLMVMQQHVKKAWITSNDFFSDLSKTLGNKLTSEELYAIYEDSLGDKNRFDAMVAARLDAGIKEEASTKIKEYVAVLIKGFSSKPRKMFIDKFGDRYDITRLEENELELLVRQTIEDRNERDAMVERINELARNPEGGVVKAGDEFASLREAESVVKRALENGDKINIDAILDVWFKGDGELNATDERYLNLLSKLIMKHRGEDYVAPPRTTPDVIEKLAPNQVYVYGANAEGRTGEKQSGQALIAGKFFHAPFIHREGLVGKTYAIPTHSLNKGRKAITHEMLVKSISDFLDFAEQNLGREFLFTKLDGVPEARLRSAVLEALSTRKPQPSKSVGNRVDEATKLNRVASNVIFPEGFIYGQSKAQTSGGPKIVFNAGHGAKATAPVQPKEEAGSVASVPEAPASQTPATDNAAISDPREDPNAQSSILAKAGLTVPTLELSKATILAENNEKVRIDDIFVEQASKKDESVLRNFVSLFANIVGGDVTTILDGSRIGTFKDKTVQRVFSEIAKLMGARLVVVDVPAYGGREIGGYYDDKNKVIVVNAGRSRAMTEIIGHEAYHAIAKKLSAKQKQMLKELLFKHTSRNVTATYQNVYSNKTDDQITEEILADMFADVVFTRDFWKEFSLKDRSLSQKFIDRILTLINGAVDIFTKYFTKQHSALYEAHLLTTDLQEMTRAFANAASSVITKPKQSPNAKTKAQVSYAANQNRNGTQSVSPEEAARILSIGGESLWDKIKNLFSSVTGTFQKYMMSDIGVPIEQRIHVDLFANRPSLAIDNAVNYKGKNGEAKGRSLKEFKQMLAVMPNSEWISLLEQAQSGKIKFHSDPNIRAFFAVAKELADSSFKMLSETYPDFKKHYNVNHYGMMLQWFKDSEPVESNSFDFIRSHGEMSVIEGKLGFTRKRSGMGITDHIAAGYTPRLLNPYDLIVNYIYETQRALEANKLFYNLAKDNMLNVGYSDTLPPEGWAFVDDGFTKIMGKVKETNDSLAGFVEGWLVEGPQGVVLKNIFPSKVMAEKYAKELGGTSKAVPARNVSAVEKTVEVGRIMVPTGVARMLNNYISVDRIRNKSWGRALLGIKNWTTALELCLSGFHAFAITQEYMAAMQAWGITDSIQNKRGINMLINNPFAQTAYTIFAPNSKNSIVFKMREINRLFDEVLSDRSNYNTEEFKRRTEAVFGKRIDKFGEIVTAYYEGGGLRKQDSTLKFYKGNIEYGHGFIKSVQGMIQKEFNDIYPTNPLIGKSVEQQKADYDKALSGMRLKMTGLKVQAQDIARELTKINKQLADGQITKEQHAQLKTDAEEKASENSAEVESLKKLIDKPFAPVPTSVTVDIANTASSKLIGAAKMTKAGLGIGNKILSDWLFEDYIPKVKFAVFALEYAQKLEANPTADATMRHAMAVDSIQFNEQRFGEMNWNNLWMNRSLKTALQLVFRSFTWQYGTFMAIGQGIKNINDAGVFQIKRVFGKQGEMKISLNEKGYWLISAITTHIFTVTMFQLMLKAFGVNKDDEDDKKDFITDSMFLYVGDQKRMAIPSYPDKLYKIVMHIVDAISYKDPAEITKIFSGAINGVTNTMMSMYLNENLGRRIYDPINDSTLKSAALLAMFAVTSRLPISVQTASKSIAEGNTLAKSAALGAAGFTPAGKHAQYTKLEQYLLHSKRKAPPVAEDKYDHKTDLLRAAKGIEKGDKSYIAELKKKGKLSVQDLKEIRSRAKVINGVKNPLYVDMKSRLMKQADLETAYKAFEVAKRDSNISRGELLKLRAIIIAKEANLKPKEVSPERRLALKKLKESLGGNKLLSISA